MSYFDARRHASLGHTQDCLLAVHDGSGGPTLCLTCLFHSLQDPGVLDGVKSHTLRSVSLSTSPSTPAKRDGDQRADSSAGCLGAGWLPAGFSRPSHTRPWPGARAVLGPLRAMCMADPCKCHPAPLTCAGTSRSCCRQSCTAPTCSTLWPASIRCSQAPRWLSCWSSVGTKVTAEAA